MRLLTYVILLLLLVQGCLPSSRLPEERGLTPQEILRGIEIPGVSGMGTFTVRQGSRLLRGQVLVVADGEGAFRIDGMDPFYRPIYTILYREGRFTVLSFTDGRRVDAMVPLYGTLTVGGFSISPVLGITLILGHPPLRDVVVQGGRAEGRLYRLDLRAGELIYQISTDRMGLPQEVRIYSPAMGPVYVQRNTFEGRRLVATEGRWGDVSIRFRFAKWEVEEPREEDFLIPSLSSSGRP